MAVRFSGLFAPQAGTDISRGTGLFCLNRGAVLILSVCWCTRMGQRSCFSGAIFILLSVQNRGECGTASSSEQLGVDLHFPTWPFEAVFSGCSESRAYEASGNVCKRGHAVHVLLYLPEKVGFGCLSRVLS